MTLRKAYYGQLEEGLIRDLPFATCLEEVAVREILGKRQSADLKSILNKHEENA